jgi:hypothetical protein
MPAFGPRTGWTALAHSLVLALAWAGSSCATRDSGYKISDETVAFIRPGITTRADVIENLGPPLYELKEPHVVAYSWGKMRAVGGKPVGVGEQAYQRQEMGYAVAPGPPEETGLVETRRWVYCLALDPGNRVTRTGKIELEGATSLAQAVGAWAGANPKR